MRRSFLGMLERIFGIQTASAHCDIPCGIYTVEPALTAAKTVVRMMEKIEELTPPNFLQFDAMQAKGKANSLVRYIAVKEEHAQKCKQELLILWTDYFKEEHLKMFSELHEKFWKAAKLCSKVKQEVNMAAAQELQAAVEDIARIFEKVDSTMNTKVSLLS